jgi:hypothetical protein
VRDEDHVPAWIAVHVDESQLPLSGYTCRDSLTPCTLDAGCANDEICGLQELINVGVAQKNCISFKVKNITLVETRETNAGFGAGYNNLYVYFAQTPLDNPNAYSIYRAALYQIRFSNGRKEPNVSEIPLSDGDFFQVVER